jgi:hypothetical protein
VVSICFFDEEVDIICWLPEKSDECGPSITVVDLVSSYPDLSGVWMVLGLFL